MVHFQKINKAKYKENYSNLKWSNLNFFMKNLHIYKCVNCLQQVSKFWYFYLSSYMLFWIFLEKIKPLKHNMISPVNTLLFIFNNKDSFKT